VIPVFKFPSSWFASLFFPVFCFIFLDSSNIDPAIFSVGVQLKILLNFLW